MQKEKKNDFHEQPRNQSKTKQSMFEREKNKNKKKFKENYPCAC